MASEFEIRRWQQRFAGTGLENERAAEAVRSLARSLLNRADLECTANAREFLEKMALWGIESERLQEIKELQDALGKPRKSAEQKAGIRGRIDGLLHIEAPTYRQVEWLLMIKENNTWITTVGDGFSVRLLLPRIWAARDDLGDRDLEWVTKLVEKSRTAIKLRHEGRFLRIACQLNMIEPEDEAA